MNQAQLKNIIEAALMVSDAPLSINRLLSLFDNDTMQPEKTDIREVLEALQQDYLERGIELKEIANGFRFQARADYADWVNRLFDERPQRYSRALLETLAIITYRQPITRGEIESIRGVSVSSKLIKTLQEREWVRVVGQRDVPGRPELLATTKQFLDHFNLKKLSDLPPLAEIKDIDKINPDLFDAVETEQGEQTTALQDQQETLTVPQDAKIADNVVPLEAEPGEQVREPDAEQPVQVDDDNSEADGNVVPFAG